MSNGEEYGILVHSFDKNKSTRICLHVQEYMGAVFLSIREFYKKDDEWKPSKKGVTIPPELYAELLQGVITAADVLGVDVPD